MSKLESVQCRAARYVLNDYSSFHSVSAMLNQLNWPFHKFKGTTNLKIIMFYKIINGLVIITPAPDLTPVLSVTKG